MRETGKECLEASLCFAQSQSCRRGEFHKCVYAHSSIL